MIPVDKRRKLNVHKTFRGRPGPLLNVLCTFNLHPVSTGMKCLEKVFIGRLYPDSILQIQIRIIL